MRMFGITDERSDGAREDGEVARVERSVAGTAPADESFESIFLHHWSVIYAVLFRLVGTREEAEDLAQEVFLRLYRKPLSTGRANNVGGWLYRVATNLGYNALRGRRRRDNRELRATADTASAVLPIDQILAAEEREEVRRALADLGERQQACLVLRHQGFSYAEIAEALDVSPTSVGTLLARAEAEFRRRYLERRGGL
jgi:RNA polymerase sigma-70 factor (ECF subfamily)